ncbi:hypothetical protein HYFRA_00010124 [Hymenoscyphus fraxineus]|uniref:Uncharacterized protein n=1 Tax=Hymenoscyphus fraxineus TaxID=746836 RepID=A0A9N9PTD1_9HELO|nr:hypothetical protein HYFRA_00010124 [Hymenoscyphus fraxineus]
MIATITTPSSGMTFKRLMDIVLLLWLVHSNAHLWERNLGSQISKQSYEEALERKDVFNDFLSSSVFGTDTIMLLPIGAPWPSYRDTYRGIPDRNYHVANKMFRSAEDTGKRLQGFGFGSISFAALGGLPQMAFPSETDHPLPSTSIKRAFTHVVG